jgi:glyoxylase-like metal-dependent hydrolase (beta-lactamase superfamily II)
MMKNTEPTTELGGVSVRIVSGGKFRLDGGSMFGIVPKPLWQRAAEADENNRIDLDTNCLLVEASHKKILIDTGFGDKLSEKQLRNIAARPGHALLEGLAALGIAPEEIDMVIFSHLHFDHAGGATQSDGKKGFRLTFPNALHLCQKTEWDEAISRLPELASTYDTDELHTLDRSGKLHCVQGATEIVPGIRVEPTGGHTRGHQRIVISGAKQTVHYLGDVCPTSAHLKSHWTMAYDLFPLEVRRLKPALLQQITERKEWVAFDHDPRLGLASIVSIDGSNAGWKAEPILAE